jgi:hypothetical protein
MSAYKILSESASEIVAKFSHTVAWVDLPNIEINGKKFVPVCGNLITPELAEARKVVRPEIPWSDESCEPGRVVTYKPIDSLVVSTYGRYHY